MSQHCCYYFGNIQVAATSDSDHRIAICLLPLAAGFDGNVDSGFGLTRRSATQLRALDTKWHPSQPTAFESINGLSETSVDCGSLDQTRYFQPSQTAKIDSP
jgi:hypothetical protein